MNILLAYRNIKANEGSKTPGTDGLNMDDISKYGRKLGSNVKEVVVKEGLHDLFLSHKPVRDALYNYIFNKTN